MTEGVAHLLATYRLVPDRVNTEKGRMVRMAREAGAVGLGFKVGQSTIDAGMVKVVYLVYQVNAATRSATVSRFGYVDTVGNFIHAPGHGTRFAQRVSTFDVIESL
jgi:isopropylmalate/homocitrate/citramalate synthase